MLAGSDPQLLVETTTMPLAPNPYLWTDGVPEPLLWSWICLVKPKLSTHKKYFTTTLSSSCPALGEGEPRPRQPREP